MFSKLLLGVLSLIDETIFFFKVESFLQITLNCIVWQKLTQSMSLSEMRTVSLRCSQTGWGRLDFPFRLMKSKDSLHCCRYTDVKESMFSFDWTPKINILWFRVTITVGRAFHLIFSGLKAPPIINNTSWSVFLNAELIEKMCKNCALKILCQYYLWIWQNKLKF